MKMKVCIVGAGTAGLCSAKHALQNGMSPTVFEQCAEIGGTWVYTDQVGTDQYGIDVHSSMYQGLRTNLPKEVMGFPDFPIPKQNESYIKAKDILNFLNLYADEFHLKEHIKFLHYVIRIRPRNNEWEVIVKELTSDRIQTYCFDYVMVCNGYYHTPAIPKLPGTELFEGKQFHSHDYRSSETVRGESVLIIGSGPSGMDLTFEISKVAERVTMSHHMTEMPKTNFLSNVTLKPDVANLTRNGAIFTDNSEQTFSIILFCTGYKFAFPFLSVDCGIHIDDNYVQPLYKHCLNINYPSMAFIGLPFYLCPSQMIDLQARFAVNFFVGRKDLPSKAEMLADTEREMERRWKKGYKKRQAHFMGPDQSEYYTDLSRTAGIDNIKPVMIKLHTEGNQRFTNDFGNFRKDVYKILDDENFIKIN